MFIKRLIIFFHNYFISNIVSKDMLIVLVLWYLEASLNISLDYLQNH